MPRTEVMRKMVADFGAQHDPRLRVIHHEGAPSSADRHRLWVVLRRRRGPCPLLFVEEARIGGDDSRVARDNLLDGAS
jgi:hypothetical protein